MCTGVPFVAYANPCPPGASPVPGAVHMSIAQDVTIFRVRIVDTSFVGILLPSFRARPAVGNDNLADAPVELITHCPTTS